MQNQRIVFMGDSITDVQRNRTPEICAAGNLCLGEGYPSLVAARLLLAHPNDNLTFFNRGVSGDRCLDLYARWQADVLNLHPDILSLLIGINDTWHRLNTNTGVSVERYAGTCRELLSWTREELPRVKLVILEPFLLPVGAVQNPGDWLPEMQQRQAIMRQLAQEFQAIFIPCQELLNRACQNAPSPLYWLRDGVHPTLAGHQLLAEAWLQATKELF